MTRYRAFSLVTAAISMSVVLWSTNPTRADFDCPDGWVPYDPETVCLKLFRNKSHSWDDADIFCRDTANVTTSREYSSLLILKDSKMFAFINEHIIPQKYVGKIALWMGIYFDYRTQTYKWVDGTNATYLRNWTSKSEPRKHLLCVVLTGPVYALADCNINIPNTLCEFRPIIKKDTCKKNNGGCQHECNDTVEGPVCTCHPGYQIYVNDTKRCDQIDWCKHSNGGCQHICTNREGFWSCSCREGYDIVSVTDCREKERIGMWQIRLIILAALSPLIMHAVCYLVCIRQYTQYRREKRRMKKEQNGEDETESEQDQKGEDEAGINETGENKTIIGRDSAAEGVETQDQLTMLREATTGEKREARQAVVSGQQQDREHAEDARQTARQTSDHEPTSSTSSSSGDGVDHGAGPSSVRDPRHVDKGREIDMGREAPKAAVRDPRHADKGREVDMGREAPKAAVRDPRHADMGREVDMGREAPKAAVRDPRHADKGREVDMGREAPKAAVREQRHADMGREVDMGREAPKSAVLEPPVGAGRTAGKLVAVDKRVEESPSKGKSLQQAKR